ncbi:MAG TPA: carboxypeptidase regulatory-like domain-containing protein [Verrucomicrobiae bacterium]
MQPNLKAVQAQASFSVRMCALSICVFAAFGLRAEASAAEAPRYYGSVTDSKGNGIAGAVVGAYHFPEQRPYPNPELLTNVITGVDGKFEVNVPAYSEFVVRKPGLAPGWREARSFKTNELPIVLSAPTTLAGVVVDKAGKPVSDAEVFVCTAHYGDKNDWAGFLWGKLARGLFSSRTDANGRFQIENFPANTRLELDVSAPGQVLPPRRCEYGSENLLWRSGQQDIRLMVEPPATIQGKIETETGEALTDARVELETVGHTFAVPWERVRGVTNGSFRFTGVAAGAYQILTRFGTNDPPDWVAETAAVSVQPGQSVAEVEIQAVKGGVLRVSSTDKRTGKPIEGVYFTVRAGSEYLHTTSGGNGLGFFRLAPGRYAVQGTKGELGFAHAEAQVEAGQTNEATLEFAAPPVVSVVVRDPSGNPAPGVSIWLHPEWPQRERKTDANGRHEFVHRENPLVVVAVDAVRDLAVSREVEEGVTNLDVRLAPALTVSGRIQDPQGKPIASTNSILYLKSGSYGYPVSWQPVTTDARGCFKLVHLPADRAYYVQVNARGYGSAQPPVPAEDDRHVELPPIVLKPATLKLAGRVVDASETPLGGVYIYVSGNGQPNMDTRTDSDGRFDLDVCPGSVSVGVHFQELQTSLQANAGDTNVLVVLKPRSGRSEPEKSIRAPLVGKALPELASVGLPRAAVVPGKPVLVCLFDCEQRPSRQALRQLNEQVEMLREKGVTVLGVQAAVVASEVFERWKEASPVPFKIGRVAEKKPSLTWATEVDSLPWLILVNSRGRVAAEGFSMEELSRKLGELTQ